MKDVQTLIKFLSNLGLSFEQSKIYLTLMDQGGQTILQISRNSGISRTNVYRHTEDLKARGLVEEVLKEEKKLIFAVGADKLDLLIKEEESKVDFLKKILPEISKFLTTTTSISQPGTKVLLYQGQEGVKQMAWNTLKAHRECVGYSFRYFPEIVGEEFAKKWEDEFLIRNLKFRDLVSDTYLASLKEYQKKLSYGEHSFKTKYIPANVLDISHQVDIYNDIVAYYGWYDDEVFGVEIHNAKNAKMQKQLFEIAWSAAEEMSPVSDVKPPTAQYNVEIK